MAAVMVIALALGVVLWVNRTYRRWQYCQEMARRHAAWVRQIRPDEGSEARRLSRLDAILARFAQIGQGPQTIEALIRESRDPEFASWFLSGRRRALCTASSVVSPTEAIDTIEHFWGRGWRQRDFALLQALAYHARMEREYAGAACRPWRSIPLEMPPEAL